jgi:hypothetical protein
MRIVGLTGAVVWQPGTTSANMALHINSRMVFAPDVTA